jgi:aquaporin NIP
LTSSPYRRWVAELLGTAVLVGISTGASVATIGFGTGRFLLLAIASFVGVSIPVFLFASISGADLNPVVTLGLTLDGRRSGREAVGYGAAQLGGAFLASALVGLAFGSFAHLGAAVPSGVGVALTFAAEFAFTFALVSTILVLARIGNGRWRWRLLWPGTVVGIATYVIGPWTGSSLNPARSIAPAVLSGTYTDLWVYLLATPAAAIVAFAVGRAVDRRLRRHA